MNESVVVFFRKLNEWKDNFTVTELDGLQEGNILERLIFAQKNMDVDSLLTIWDELISLNHLDIPHPEFSQVKSRAVNSHFSGMTNFVLFLDDYNENPWIMVQSVSLIDLIITPNGIYKVSKFNNHTIWPHIDKVPTFFSDVTDYKNADAFSIIVKQARPYHFFYDMLKYVFYSIDCNKKIKDLIFSGFYVPDLDIDGDNKENSSVKILPTVAPNNIFPPSRFNVIKNINERMEAILFGGEGEVSHSNILSGKLVIWFGITGQKRSWLQQVTGLTKIVTNLRQYFDTITVYIDGLTSPENQSIKALDDLMVFNKINSSLGGVCEVHSMIGLNYKQKIQISKNIDIFVANAGTGCMVPMRFARKPGVLHSNTRLESFDIPENVNVQRVDKFYIVDVDIENRGRTDFLSYHIPWQHIYNLVSNVLKDEYGILIDKLEVPSVKFVEERWNNQQVLNEKNKSVLNKTKTRIKSGFDSADVLREVALSFEQIGDFSTAKVLMEKALDIRPEGKFIQRKLNEYYIKLDG